MGTLPFDVRPILQMLAQLLPQAPDVEDQLVMFEITMLSSAADYRADAAQMVRDAAGLCADDARRERLQRAADALAAGEPCAVNQYGVTAAQARGITEEERERRKDEFPMPAPPGESDSDEGDEDEEDEELDSGDYLAEAPPGLPHLPVRHFFSGLVMRAAQGFTDAAGRVVEAGDVLRLLSLDTTDTGFKLNLLVRSILLKADDPKRQAIAENAGNAWLEPVPSIDCLRELWEAINSELSAAEEDESLDDFSDEIEVLREKVDACADWMEGFGVSQAPAPRLKGARIAARIFGEEHPMNDWVALLFAALPVARPEL